MADRPVPRIVIGGSPCYGLTSPREIDEARLGRRVAPVVLHVEVPVGSAGKTKTVQVPLTRADLLRLNVATAGALAVLDGMSVS